MKIKKEYLVPAAIILVLLIYLIFSGGRNKMTYEVPRLKNIAAEKIDRIEIVQGEKSVSLEKRDGAWKILPGDYPADDVAVGDMLKVIENLTLTELAAEHPNDQRYELDDEHRIDVEAFSGENPVRSFQVGKTSSTYRHTFVRLNDDESVYYAQESFRSDFNREIKDLRDKKVLSLERAEISAIHIEKDGDSLTLKKTVSQAEEPQAGGEGTEEKAEPETAAQTVETWQTDDGRTAKADEVDSILSALTDLRCDDYIEDKTPESVSEAPIFSIVLTGNREYTLRIYPKQEGENGKYPAVSSENAYLFLLSTYTAERIMKSPADLIESSEGTVSDKN